VRVLCIGLVAWIAGVSPVSSAPRNVFLLFDERLDFPGLAALDADLIGTLGSNSPDRIEVYREAMDLSRFGSDAYRSLLREFLRAKYANMKIDVAVAVPNANAGIRWLAAATPDIGEADAAFKRIVAAGHHAGEVVATVRSLFKQRAEQRAEVKINDLIHNALSLERIELQKRQVSLRLDLAQGLPDVLGDRVQLLQVILNLIRNAIEAMSTDRRRVLGVKSQVTGRAMCWYQWKIPERESTRRTLLTYSNHSSRLSSKA
jgi:signal transduction histidine kinase